MPQRKAPPSIHFNEELSQKVVPKKLFITKVLGFCTFGLIKTNAQASIVALVLVVAGAVASVFFVREVKTIEPTTTFEILPQESIGSSQGLPPVVPTYE